MNPQRDRLSHRRAPVGAIEPLLVEPVACLMEDAKKGIGEIPRVVAGGDPTIVGTNLGAKRMRRDIEPTALEIESKLRGHHLSENPLPLSWVVALQHADVGPAGSCRNRLNQRHQPLPQRFKQRGQIGRSGPRLIVVEKGIIVGWSRPKAGSLLPLESPNLLKSGLKPCVARSGPRLDPHLLAERCGPGQFLNQPLGQFCGAVKSPPPFPHVHCHRRIR